MNALAKAPGGQLLIVPFIAHGKDVGKGKKPGGEKPGREKPGREGR